MSAAKFFALGVMMTGSLASPSLAGSMHGGHQHVPRTSPTSLFVIPPAPRPQPTIAALNLATSDQSPAPNNGANSSPGGSGSNGAPLTLGTSQGQGISSSNAASPAPSSGNSPSTPPDAFINFGNGPFSEADSLTNGNARPFTSSPAFTQFFGKGGPTAQDVAHFESEVVATVQKTYDDAQLPLHLTTRPSDNAAHTLSVVSGTSNPQSPNAIGITDVGNNGFSFIDKLAGAPDLDSLAVAVGHNLAHELMHAFGIANHPETTGPYVDAATTTLANLDDPKTDFSPVAANLLSTLNFQDTGQSVAAPGAQRLDGDQILVPLAQPTPEPSTVALWGVLALSAALARRRAVRSA